MKDDELKAELDQCNSDIRSLDLTKATHADVKALMMQQRAIIAEMVNSLEY